MDGTSFHLKVQREFVWMEGGEKERKGCCISFPARLTGRKQDHGGKGCGAIWADVNISILVKISKPEAWAHTVELPRIQDSPSPQ